MKVYYPCSKEFKITSPYGLRKDPITGEDASHYGVDFGVPIGTPIVAVVDGRIYKAGWQNEKDRKEGFGLRVWQTFSKDGKEYSVFYGHLSEISVGEEIKISAGTRIGLSGSTGKSTGPHLHLEIRPEGQKGVPIEFI